MQQLQNANYGNRHIKVAVEKYKFTLRVDQDRGRADDVIRSLSYVQNAEKVIRVSNNPLGIL